MIQWPTIEGSSCEDVEKKIETRRKMHRMGQIAKSMKPALPTFAIAKVIQDGKTTYQVYRTATGKVITSHPTKRMANLIFRRLSKSVGENP